jgi:hypothetical protein
MQRIPRCSCIVVVLAGLLVAAAAAQKAPKVKYDPATEVKVSGVIDDIKEFECPASGALGYHITLKSPDRVTVVHVAAAKFIKEYEISFAKGEQIQVVGSKVRLPDGEEGVLAREITRGQSTYAFRDKQGNPLW